MFCELLCPQPLALLSAAEQGSGINVGLLYLGMVIKELSEKGSTLAYRNSMLTEVLRPGALLRHWVGWEYQLLCVGLVRWCGHG